MHRLKHYFPELTLLQISQFEQLPQLYENWNGQINVISRKDLDSLLIHHVLHSLAIARYVHLAPGSVIIDLGTGGGFPAIPLAIFFSDVQVLGVDSIAKKIKVVNAVANHLKLDNLQALAVRTETLTIKADFVVNRAVAPLSQLVRWSRHLIKKEHNHSVPNGLLSLKGGDLGAEISNLKADFPATVTRQVKLSEYFSEDYFETKKLLHTTWPV